MRRKKMISECNYPWGEFSPTHAINHYLGCAYNCPYCWARDIWWARMGGHLSRVWGVPKGFEWRHPLIFDDYRTQIGEELFGHRWPPETRILLCSTTDPYQPLEETHYVTRWILEQLAKANMRTVVLTKAGLLPQRDFDLLRGMDAWFGITMDRYHDESLWLHQRVATLHAAHSRGIKTFVSLEPWIPGIDAERIVLPLSGFTDHWIAGPLNYRGVDRQFYREKLPGLISLFEERGLSYYIKPDLRRCMGDNFKVGTLDSPEGL